MKLIQSNGLELTVRDAGPVLVRFVRRPGGPPLKQNGVRVVDDDKARDDVREVLASGWYERVP
jgi:hypothetical protein